jgi:predicted DNA-binding mobile mystery protein A
MKTMKEQKLITRQVSRKLEGVRELAGLTRGITSWIDYVRGGLGMSIVQLAKRAGVSQAAMSNSIKLEKEGRITVHKLREIASALECELVYEFVPRKKLEEIILDQAERKTIKLMEQTETHMALEDQTVTLDKNERLKELSEERIYSRFLWDE